MKRLVDIITERRGEPIDEQWINDEKPVMTKDGRQVIIKSVDYSEVPNIIKGDVKIKDKLVPYKWYDDGTCMEATDMRGNPQKPGEGDILVKAE